MGEKKQKFVFSFEKLEVRQLSVELADFILGLLERFPSNKHLRLIGQMEAAVSGIGQNAWPVK
jgi:hypothetical protein